MKIKKFESYKFNYNFGGHCFVMARHKKGWADFFRATHPFDNNEYVPCMVSGNPVENYQHYNIYIIGDQHSYNINDFDIIEGSEFVFNDIKIFSKANKYNI